MLRMARGVVVAAVAGVASGGTAVVGVGCTAIAGIQNGVLTATDSGAAVDGPAGGEASTDSGSQPDGLSIDSAADGTVGGDSGPPVDASDSGSPPPIRCTIDTGSKTLIADLSSQLDAGSSSGDAGSSSGNAAQFSQGLWAVPFANDNNGVGLAAQVASDQNDFTFYQLNFGQGAATPVAIGSSSMGGVRLIDVEPTPSGPFAALTTVGTGTDTQALQVAILPNNGSAPGTVTTISATVLNGAYPNSGFLLPTGASTYDWLLTENGNGLNQLLSGNSAFMDQTLLSNGSQSLRAQTRPFDLDGNLYAFISGAGDAGSNASTLFTYPDDFSGTGTQSRVATSAALSTLLTAHVSATDSTKAALLGASIDMSGAGSAQIYSAHLPASSLTALTLGPPQFTNGATLGLSEVPFNASTAVPYGDQMFLVGTGTSDATTVLLLWLDGNGVALAHPAVMGPLLSTGGNVVRAATVAVARALSEFTVNLFFAWIEEIQGTGGEYDRLWAAQVTCQPFSGD